ncbi:hypothetical protein [Methylobacterium aquaticum]|jgi:hypothetical protein|uniref:Hemophore-related protein n=1 Tax=Methylobacterium aquaticum TaxID=270351 RepID=A0A0J6SKZ3_9HYPH|nr:hypothetical protein [Methylobacterium aquaticum]KMO34287.1 hypothetical protein VP06_14530 [Methylobacterium aquaticum]
MRQAMPLIAACALVCAPLTASAEVDLDKATCAKLADTFDRANASNRVFFEQLDKTPLMPLRQRMTGQDAEVANRALALKGELVEKAGAFQRAFEDLSARLRDCGRQ